MAEEYRFDDTRTAELALAEAGFSVGTRQRDAPRGLMHGDVAIAKWRNLSNGEVADLDGVLERLALGPDAPVKVRLHRHFPSASAVLERLANG